MKAEVEFQKKLCQEVETVEQKRPADIFQELLDYLWNGLGLEEKGWKRLKKGDFNHNPTLNVGFAKRPHRGHNTSGA